MSLEPSGHVYRVERVRGPQWYAKYRLPEGRQVPRRIGSAWSGRGRPPAGHFTERTAEAWLHDVLDQARTGTLPGLVRTGVTFAEAADEWLRYVEHDRERKPSTRAQALRPPLQPRRRCREALARSQRRRRGVLARGGHGARADGGLPAGCRDLPHRGVHRPTPWRAARAALARCRLLRQVMRVRASYAEGALTTPKSGKVRSVPMAPDVAEALARLAQRERWTGDDELVFVGEAGHFLDGRALSRRYVAAVGRAGLRPLRFHDLRHTFGKRMIAKADIRRVQEWMGHADVQTTMKYLHYVPREKDAELVAEAFRLETDPVPARKT